MSYKCISVKRPRLGIVIREFANVDSAKVDRYFRAVILGWSNFKFVSDTLKPQQLLEATIKKAEELRDKIKEDRNSLETMETVYKLN